MHRAKYVVMAVMSIAAIASAGEAQTRRLKVVTGDGQPVSYAYVSIERGPSYIADENGELVLKERAKSIGVTIRRIGFEPWSGRIGEADSTMRISLMASASRVGIGTADPSDVSLAAVNTRAFYGRWLLQQAGELNATFIGPEEIQARQPKLVTDLLFGVRGVSVRKSLGALGNRVALGSVGSCAMRVLVDGDLRCPRPNVKKEVCGLTEWSSGPEVDIDSIVSVPGLAGIEVYPHEGDIPRALYAYPRSPGCGLIAIWSWTRRSKP